MSNSEEEEVLAEVQNADESNVTCENNPGPTPTDSY